MESKDETSELQQLVPNDGDADNDGSTVQGETNVAEEKTMSPIRSKPGVSSSGNTSHSSVNKSAGRTLTASSRLIYVNEKRAQRDKHNTSTKARNLQKGSNSTTVKHHSFISQVPDVRNMEKALLGLLEDFHSGKLRAFSGSCTMEQMTNIREQQEKLAKMHFDLTSQNDPSLTDESLKQSQNSMSQLIERLEQLSMSIEALHSDVEK